jgi:hypothetical protein
MSRASEAIDKYGLRDIVGVHNVLGQKMDEDCIQKFVNGDPSGNGKYLDWMFLQAGGGTERLNKANEQWEKGDHTEPSIEAKLRVDYVNDCKSGYLDDNGKWVEPVSEEVAIHNWETVDRERYRLMHIYGDEEYAISGFGFYRSWPGHNSHYEQIVQTVQRFHRHTAKLVSLGKSTDLCAKNYPDLRNLLEALADITFLEIKYDLDYDVVYEDRNLIVICPFNIGASMRFGHMKWCTANESMFRSAVAGQGPNRWKEYAKDAAFYYCRWKPLVDDSYASRNREAPTTRTGCVSRPTCEQVAVQAPWGAPISSWKWYDITDTVHSMDEMDRKLRDALAILRGHELTAESAKAAMIRHHLNYPRERLNLEFVLRPKPVTFDHAA